MKRFILINVRDIKKATKYNNDCLWKRSNIIPYYKEEYICFSRNENYSFDELINLFLGSTDEEEIGSISVIAENFPYELYMFVYENRNYMPKKRVEFLFNYVIPDYLPLILPKESIISYDFNEDFSDDIWVKLLLLIKRLL